MGDYAHTLTVRYAETDSQGVVFNSHYQALCDAVFDLWVRDRMGKAWQKEVGVNFSMVVASRFQYRSPAVFLDELTIRGEVTRWGRTSFEVSWLGDVRGEREGEPQRRVFEGVMTYVCVDGDETDARRRHLSSEYASPRHPRATLTTSRLLSPRVACGPIVRWTRVDSP